jgi:3-hydroxyisobutyrate dehydrogenase
MSGDNGGGMKVIEPGKTRIGWVGTGIMGLSMCGHVLRAGYSVTVHTRSREKAEPLLAEGASWAETPKAAAQGADVVITMVGFPADVLDVYFGEEGVFAGATSGTVLVDMTTSPPSLAREIYAAAKAKGIESVDAPVTGGEAGAREARLSILVGGEPGIVESLRPLFGTMGMNIVRQGEAGAGQHAKMCNQIVIAGTMIGVCESLLYGQRAGLDMEALIAGIGAGAASCWTLKNLAPRILRRDLEPGFFVEHFVKDMEIALEEAERMKLSLPGLSLVHELYSELVAAGGGRKGTQALMLVLEQMNSSAADEEA